MKRSTLLNVALAAALVVRLAMRPEQDATSIAADMHRLLTESP